MYILGKPDYIESISERKETISSVQKKYISHTKKPIYRNKIQLL